MPDTDRILVRDLRCRGILGINPIERTRTQEIVVNLVLHVDTRPAAASDDIADAVDYDSLATDVRAVVAESECLLVERLAALIAERALADPRVERVRVTVEKPEAVPAAASVGVSIVRERADA